MKLAFLFLTIADLHQEEIWRDYFRGNEPSCLIRVHAKHPDRVESDWLRASLLPGAHEGAWGRLSQLQAQLVLLRCALRDPDTERFILLSESCIPIKTFDRAFEALGGEPRSRLWHARGKNPERFEILTGRETIGWERFRKNSQWVALNRRHAALLASGRWSELFDGHGGRTHPAEHYFATALAMHGVALEREVVCASPTFVDWSVGDRPSRPRTFEALKAADVERLAGARYLFARKFSPASNVRRHWSAIVDAPVP